MVINPISVRCSSCDGKGRYLDEDCETCNGHGVKCGCGGHYTAANSGYTQSGLPATNWYLCEKCRREKVG